MRKGNKLVILLAGTLAGLAGCQPEAEPPEVDPGAIPAAPDMRPGAEAVPAPAMTPGAAADTVGVDPAPLPGETPPAVTDTV